jgi:gamma-glutamylcyclotransferase
MKATSSLLYFAYGSNMSQPRLRARVASAECIGTASLTDHALRFHKVGRDGSGKATIAPRPGTYVHGVVFRLDAEERPILDRHEDLGRGYEARWISVERHNESPLHVFTYNALLRDPSLQPYSWYLEHVLHGARENRLPPEYIEGIAATSTITDPDGARDLRERSIYR